HRLQDIAWNLDSLAFFNAGHDRVFFRIKSHELDLRGAGADDRLEMLLNLDFDMLGRQLADNFHEKFGRKDYAPRLLHLDDLKLAFLYRDKALNRNIRVAGRQRHPG